MKAQFFTDMTSASGAGGPHTALLDLRSGGAKVLVISDLHMGSGPRDDLA